MRYDQETLQAINDNADLFAYAQQTFTLERRGDDYYTHCPLHVDLTPSLSFSPDKNFYYCFSCGKKGKIINFLMDFEGLKFDAAVQKAARLANFDLDSVCKSETMSFLKSYKSRNLSARQKTRYIHDKLPENAMTKFEKQDIKEWREEGILPEVMDLFGVRVDRLSNRIVYPVCDMRGNIINIKGRTRYGNYKELKLPKYINYCKVGCLDYFQGLNITLPFVKEKREIVIFESIKSVMKAYGWGYKNCASAETHTLTPQQIELLIKLHVDVVLAFDTDVDVSDPVFRKNIDTLRRMTNVYIITDQKELLGGKDLKNSPADCGQSVWEELYRTKRKVV